MWNLDLDFGSNWSKSLISSLQNKVLAVIDAIEAAQYLISQNATHLINRVTDGITCSVYILNL